jgi:uncharacterized protein YjbI with pentapeptide repeats
MAKSGWSPAAPRLAGELRETQLGDLEDDLLLVGREVRGDCSGQAGDRIALEECRVVGARFTGAELTGLRLHDGAIVGADFSGADLEESELVRCSLVDCRLSGIVLSSAQLRDVTITGCKMDGANLRMLRTERVRFDHVDLHDTQLNGAQLTTTCFYDCDLRQAEISHAALGGARLHGSVLDELRGMAYLKDAVIESAQVFAVARGVLEASGIRIDDEREAPA